MRDKFTSKKRTSVKKNVNGNNIKEIKKDDFDKYEILAQKIDEGKYNIEYEEIIEKSEEVGGLFTELSHKTSQITDSVNFLGTKMNEKTKQIDRIINIKDERLRLNKGKKISNDLALDMDKYSDDLESLVPEFTNVLNRSIDSYTSIILKTIDSTALDENIKNDIHSNLPIFVESLDNAIDGTASFLESFTKLHTHLTSKFSTSKRRAELETNNFFKALINARKILKKLIDDNNIK